MPPAPDVHGAASCQHCAAPAPCPQACLTTAIEAGHSTVVFQQDQVERAEQWSRLAAFRPVFQQKDGALHDAQVGGP